MLGKTHKQEDASKDQALEQLNTLHDKVQEHHDVMKEKVAEYKKAHPEILPDCDFAFLLKTLRKMNENSRVRVAKNAFNEKREWIPGTEMRNVGKVYLSEDRCVTFTLRGDGGAITIDDLFDLLAPIEKKLPMKNVPIKLALSEEKHVQITDIYAHSLVSDQWAGLPVDLVLCYTDKKE